MAKTAREVIEKLDLSPHPEGGWYRETWRAPSAKGERAGATAIHFLLEAGRRSHWHRIDAAEIWLWHAGDPLALKIAPTDRSNVESVVLGGHVLAGETPQHVIPAHWWQAAEPIAGPRNFTLVSCVVSPAFEFSGFELADAGWEPGA